MKYGVGNGMKWTIGQTVTSRGQKFIVVKAAETAPLIEVLRYSDGAAYIMHEHCFAEHPINGGNYGESNDTESPA